MTFYACEEAIRLINAYRYPEGVDDEVTPVAGKGEAITEAPRGILFHRYTINEDGLIKNARIVAPTSHNQKVMELDLKNLVEQNQDLNDQLLTERCESSIRNYDPCISCSTHFLNVTIDRH
jgi:coenzyme F420-reducing hydrogenase alpha subunit